MFTSSSRKESHAGTTIGFNCDDVSSVTESIQLDDNFNIGLFVHDNSGSHNTHEITIQLSNDNITWVDSNLIVIGLGYIEGTTVATYIRAKVTKVQNQESSVNIELISK